MCGNEPQGCSGEVNRKIYFYHSGKIEDIQTIIGHITNLNNYDEMSVIGISLGGNMILKYLGKKKNELSPILKTACAISVPCSLSSCCDKIEKSKIYSGYFVKKLLKKIIDKSIKMPGRINTDHIMNIRTIREFDDYYTAPFNGFKDAEDYYEKASSLKYLSKIEIPTLLLNAKDDPLLDKNCFPVMIAKKSKYLFLESPDHGGHVGFISLNKENEFYHETRVCSFVVDKNFF